MLGTCLNCQESCLPAMPQTGLGGLRGPGRAWTHSAVGGGLTTLLLLPGGRGYEADARKEERWKSHPGS